ncbi:MAG: two-component regulator propeller domain-containing protein, partial [Saprospiraceae bacterium]|nr:two-component regulator propeller domain-containing protein [Saprospiraceae bacterium]
MKDLLQIYRSTFLFIALLLCTLSTFHRINAQALEADTITTNFDLIGVNDGLLAGYITNITVDKTGFLWVGTNFGLQRYDGNQFIDFKHHEGDNFTSPNVEVSSILDDGHGRVWIRNYKSKTYIFEKSTERFISIPFDINRFLFIDASDNFWFIDPSHQLCVLPLHKLPEDLTRITTDWKNEHVKCLLNDDQKLNFNGSRIYLYPDQSIWVIKQNIIYKYSINLEKARLILDFERVLEQEIHDDKIYHPNLQIDSSTNKLYLFHFDKICEIDPRTGNSLQCFNFPEGYTHPTPWLTAPNGDIWVTVSGIIATVNLEKQKLTEFRILSKVSSPKGNVKGRRPIIDRNQNVWITTNGYGIYKYSYLKNRFKYAGDNHEGPALSVVALEGTEIIIESGNFRGFFERENRKFINLYKKSYVPSCAGYPLRFIIPTLIKEKTYRLDFSCWEEKKCYTSVVDENGNLLSPVKETICSNLPNSFKPLEGHPDWFYSEEQNKSKKTLSLQLKYAPRAAPN